MVFFGDSSVVLCRHVYADPLLNLMVASIESFELTSVLLQNVFCILFVLVDRLTYLIRHLGHQIMALMTGSIIFK